MAVVGLYFIGLVFGGDIADPNIAILYVTIAVLAFTFVLLTLTRMRRGIRIGAYTPLKVFSWSSVASAASNRSRTSRWETLSSRHWASALSVTLGISVSTEFTLKV